MTSRLGMRTINVTWYLKTAQRSFLALKMRIIEIKKNRQKTSLSSILTWKKKYFIKFRLVILLKKNSLWDFQTPLILLKSGQTALAGYVFRYLIVEPDWITVRHFQIRNLKSRKRTNDKSGKTDFTKLQKSRFVGRTRERSAVFSKAKWNQVKMLKFL